jgi:hypothetical protein
VTDNGDGFSFGQPAEKNLPTSLHPRKKAAESWIEVNGWTPLVDDPTWSGFFPWLALRTACIFPAW